MKKLKLLFFLGSFALVSLPVNAQYGFLWNEPVGDSLAFDNNQYQCPLFESHHDVFDYEKLKGSKGQLKTHVLLIRDFNNDNFCDLFIAFAYPYGASEDSPSPDSSFTPYFLMLFNPQTGELEDSSSLIKNNVGQPHPRKGVSADFNNDGILDFGIVGHPTNDGSNSSYFDIVLSDSTGWTQHNLLKTHQGASADSEYYHGMAVGDIDNDGDLDIVISNHSIDGLITLLNNGEGVFEQFYSVDRNNTDASASSFTNELFDFNGDGCLDTIMSGDVSTPTYAGTILFGTCDGYFGPEYYDIQVSQEEITTDLSMQDYVFTDFNRDGLVDIITSIEYDGYAGGKILFLANSSTESGEVKFDDVTASVYDKLTNQGFGSDYLTGSEYRRWDDFIHLLDLNNDGYLDIITPTLFDTNTSCHEFFDILAYDNYLNPCWALINDKQGSYDYIKFPITKKIESVHSKVLYENLVIDFDMELLVDIGAHEPWKGEIKTFRGEIKDWFIYYSDSPFLYTTEPGVKKVLAAAIVSSADSLHHFERNVQLSIDHEGGKEIFFRIVYTNAQGVEFPTTQMFTNTTEIKRIGSPELLNPQNNGENIGTLTEFTWGSVEDAASYNIQVSSDEFINMVVDSSTVNSNLTLSENLSQNQAYQWRVKAVHQDTLKNSTWSDFYSFNTGVRTATENGNTLPTSYSLNQNYPNPFNPTTSITYSLPHSAVVSLKIYDITGKYITTLVDGVTSAGIHTVTFDAGSLSSGMYVYTLETDGYRQSRQMMLVK